MRSLCNTRSSQWRKALYFFLCTVLIISSLLPESVGGRPINRKKKKDGEASNDENQRPKKDRGTRNLINRNKLNRVDREKSNKMCHHEALRRCGRSAVNQYELEVGEKLDKVSYVTKCRIRELFFRCLEVPKDKKCRTHHPHKNQELLKKVSELLWSTRGCLLGVDM